MAKYTVRPIVRHEVDQVANLISTGYYHDPFFIWSVPCDSARHQIVADYYKIYLTEPGAVAHVAQTPAGAIIGASVWLPHDVDACIYDDIDRVAGPYAPQFRAVADKSHLSEPPVAPFYQLVGFVVAKEAQGMGVGGALLKYHLDILDEKGIPTYLEASTPYFGGGVYGRFGYQPVGELMVFAKNAVLYPLWRPAKKPKPLVRFGRYDWRVMEIAAGRALLLSEKVIVQEKFHHTFEPVTWQNSSARQYLNSTFYDTFTPEEQAQIVETSLVTTANPWYGGNDGDDTHDKIFLPTVEDVLRYFGGLNQPNPANKFFIDDSYNQARQAGDADNTPCRWTLRTPGNQPGFVATVTLDGRISLTGDFVNRESTDLFKVGLRPALWVTENALTGAPPQQ
ncbi:MAG: GNAT family N-acetyltransferase [Defluviitaleaceae bacterium]|nr:GNAT family N-acetyltransferase [Defluviitaleaceae bacterium]